MISNKTYHLYTHANGFENLFRSDENYKYFLKRYEHFIPSVVDTLAYCLMPNHIHFLVRVKTEKEILESFPSKQTSNTKISDTETSEVLKTSEVLEKPGDLSPVEKRISQQFSNLFNGYSKAFNKMFSRRGSLFIPKFKRKEITSDSYFTKIIHYIHANPVHHGFVKAIEDWPWSSFHTLLNGQHSFLKTDEVIRWFGNTEEFIKYHRQPIDVKAKQEFDIKFL